MGFARIPCKSMCVICCRACASASRRCWKCTDQTGVRPERTGPSSCSPHRTSEFAMLLHLFLSSVSWSFICDAFRDRAIAETQKDVDSKCDLIQMLSSSRRMYLIKTTPRKRVAASVPHFINRRDRFLSIDHCLPNNKVIFSTHSPLVREPKTDPRGYM